LTEYSLLLNVAVTGILLGGLYSLVAAGLNIIYGVVRILNIAHGDILMLGSYLAVFLFTIFGVTPLISALIALLVFGLLGAALYVALFSRIAGKLQSQRVESNSLLVAFGLIAIIEGAASLTFRATQRYYQFLSEGIEIVGISFVPNRLLAFIVAAAISGCLYAVIRWTWLGRSIRCVMNDPVASKVVGINTERVYLFATALGFALAGAAGTMISMLYVTTPFVGLGYTIIAFVVVVVGGAGSIRGSWIAGMIVGLTQTVGVYYTSPAMQIVISYMLLIAVLLVRPKGLFGRGQQL
jgi:branched-chain amino acid transport system permease protein